MSWPWTKEEIAVLVERQGEHPREIAKHLDRRAPRAVTKKLRELGIEPVLLRRPFSRWLGAEINGREVVEIRDNQVVVECSSGHRAVGTPAHLRSRTCEKCDYPVATVDLVGQELGGRIVVSAIQRPAGGWDVVVRCSRGHEARGTASALEGRACKRCRGYQVTHGMTGSPEYDCWGAIVQRCQNPNCAGYPHYGGRGIEIRYESFSDFLDDVGPRPGDNFSIDRIDNNGHYEPGNCRWVTQREQTRNTRRNIILECRGERKCSTDWAKESPVTAATIRKRVQRGWPVEEAIFAPAHSRRGPSR